MARTVDEIKSEIANVGYQTQDASDVLDKARDEFHLLLVREGDLAKELLAVLEGQTS